MPDGKATYLILDAMKDSLTDQQNIDALTRQFNTLFNEIKPDTVIAVDTGGDGLYQEVAAVNLASSKTTPDQDLRVLKALNQLNLKHLVSMEVATGIDSPDNAAEILHRAEASYYQLSADEKSYLLARYKMLGMDATSSRPDQFGKTALAWQQTMIPHEKGNCFVPLPTSRLLDPKSPWNPVVYLDEAMAGIFVMNLRQHVAAISKPAAKDNNLTTSHLRPSL